MAHVSDELDKLSLSGGNKMLGIAVLHRNIPLVPDILRPMFSACKPPYCSILLGGSLPKWQKKLWMNSYFRIVSLVILCIFFFRLIWYGKGSA